MGFLSKALKKVKKAVKKVGDAHTKIAGGVLGKRAFDQLSGKTAMKAQERMMNEQAAQADEQARVAASENRIAAQSAATSAALQEATSAATAQAAAAGAPVGNVDVDIEDGSLADPQRRRRRYTPGSGMPLTV